MSDNSFSGINFNDNESSTIFQKHSEMMCPKYKNLNESGFMINLNVKYTNNNSFIISGNVNTNFFEKRFIKYTAANPPTYNNSFSGSALPYPTEEIAYENTPNRGVVEIVNGKFSFTIRYPNSYYINIGTIFVKPHLKLILVDKDNKTMGDIKVVQLGESAPFRTLTWPIQRDWNKGPLFYQNNNLPVRTQYEVLLDSAYPSENIIPKNFWGLINPH
jgi:hypothetical protein